VARAGGGSGGALRPLATELVNASVDLIVMGGGDPVARAVRAATTTIPVIFASVGDPVEAGLVTSLSRPGGNFTGPMQRAPGSAGKRVDLLRDLIPGLTRMVALVNPLNLGNVSSWNEVRAAAESAGIHVDRVDIRSADELDTAFAHAGFGGAQALDISSPALLRPVRARVV